MRIINKDMKDLEKLSEWYQSVNASKPGCSTTKNIDVMKIAGMKNDNLCRLTNEEVEALMDKLFINFIKKDPNKPDKADAFGYGEHTSYQHIGIFDFIKNLTLNEVKRMAKEAGVELLPAVHLIEDYIQFIEKIDEMNHENVGN